MVLEIGRNQRVRPVFRGKRNRFFVGARAALGLVLVAALALGALFGLRPTPSVIAISVAYAALARC